MKCQRKCINGKYNQQFYWQSFHLTLRQWLLISASNFNCTIALASWVRTLDIYQIYWIIKTVKFNLYTFLSINIFQYDNIQKHCYAMFEKRRSNLNLNIQPWNRWQLSVFLFLRLFFWSMPWSKHFLADPGEARGCSTYSLVIHSLINYFSQSAFSSHSFTVPPRLLNGLK